MTRPIRVFKNLHDSAVAFSDGAAEIRSIYDSILSQSTEWKTANGRSDDLEMFNQKFDQAASLLENLASALEAKSDMLDQVADLYEQARQRAVRRAGANSGSIDGSIGKFGFLNKTKIKINVLPPFKINVLPPFNLFRTEKKESGKKDNLWSHFSFELPILKKGDDKKLIGYKSEERYQYQTSDGKWHDYTEEDYKNKVINGKDVEAVSVRKKITKKNDTTSGLNFSFNPGKGKIGFDLDASYTGKSTVVETQEGGIYGRAMSKELIECQFKTKLFANTKDGFGAEVGYSHKEYSHPISIPIPLSDLIFGKSLEIKVTPTIREGFVVGAKTSGYDSKVDLGLFGLGISIGSKDLLEMRPVKRTSVG